MLPVSVVAWLELEAACTITGHVGRRGLGERLGEPGW
jgi:hypothetical protein